MSSSGTAEYRNTKIEAIRRLSPEVLCVGLQVPTGYQWTPGQYLGVTHERQGKLSYYSIASAQSMSNGALIELAMHEPSIKWPGPLQLGDELFLSQPGGGPKFDALINARHVVLIGMGTGVAPLRAVMQAVFLCNKTRASASDVFLLHGARDRQNCIFFQELTDLQHETFVYAPVLSRVVPEEMWTGRVGRVQSHLDGLPVSDVYYCVCGKLPMVSEITHLLVERGVEKDQIFSEGY